MRWFIKQNDAEVYWRQNPEGELGVSGEFISDRKEATRISDETRLTYIAEKGNLPYGFAWVPVVERHKIAIEVQNAVNPAGVARALHDAYCEVIAEGGDTRRQQGDPACRLILFHLMTLSGMGPQVPTIAYNQAYDICAKEVEYSKK